MKYLALFFLFLEDADDDTDEMGEVVFNVDDVL